MDDAYDDCWRWLLEPMFVGLALGLASPESPWNPDLKMLTKLVMEPSEFCFADGVGVDEISSSVWHSESDDLARLGRIDSQASLSSSADSDRFRLQALQPLVGELVFFCPSTIRSLSGDDGSGFCSPTARDEVLSGSGFSSLACTDEASVGTGWQFSLSSVGSSVESASMRWHDCSTDESSAELLESPQSGASVQSSSSSSTLISFSLERSSALLAILLHISS